MSDWTPTTETGWKALAGFAKLRQKHEIEKEKARAEEEPDPPKKENSDGASNNKQS